MFDIGFFEILIICLISLIILGPKRLPSFLTSLEELYLKTKSGLRKLKQELYSEGFYDQNKDDDQGK
jgi:sec-independent protein translocase protein TatB